MNKTELFQELCSRISKLNELLKEPEFGCVSWCMLYAEHMKWIADYWINN